MHFYLYYWDLHAIFSQVLNTDKEDGKTSSRWFRCVFCLRGSQKSCFAFFSCLCCSAGSEMLREDFSSVFCMDQHNEICSDRQSSEQFFANRRKSLIFLPEMCIWCWSEPESMHTGETTAFMSCRSGAWRMKLRAQKLMNYNHKKFRQIFDSSKNLPIIYWFTRGFRLHGSGKIQLCLLRLLITLLRESFFFICRGCAARSLRRHIVPSARAANL